jgi:hypothetical protein
MCLVLCCDGVDWSRRRRRSPMCIRQCAIEVGEKKKERAYKDWGLSDRPNNPRMEGSKEKKERKKGTPQKTD